ncbi:glucokinase [Arenicella chitinivorans]|uniref:Glucokinase n=1 Tax=Arenicella chitinivorans TaxID=1329800 RepID=A0A918RM25_9GAMM|nr:glucokinase [Arenicella chitinivorans]GHA05052.1 glucokinase [Arenicella chitinivorans]
MSDNPTLIADIGGTNARFALTTDAPRYFQQAQTLEAAEFEHVSDAIDTYLHSHNIKQLKAISLAVAGPIRDGKVTFPNSHWSIDCHSLRARYHTDHVKLLNDWEAISYSLSCLDSGDLINIGGTWDGLPDSDYTVGALGPGSGLGMSGLLRRNDVLIPLVTEGGHAGFSPENQLQGEILAYLHQKFDDRISRERLLSGPGLVNIHEALCEIHGQENPGLIAADIAVAGINKTDPICEETFDLFFEVLGQVAGDIALALGANDGIFIGGGICQRYPNQLLASRFRKGFENKGRHSPLMKDIPTWLITHKNPGLLGASVFAQTNL